MTKRRKKPYDPAAAARHRAEREANAEMVSTLKAQHSTAVNLDPRTGKLVGAKRLNCFEALLDEGDQRLAIEWLDDLIRTANGENGQERRPDFIRASVEGAPGQNVSQSMIDASEELAAVEFNLYPACARLIFGLLKPDAALEANWRGVVQETTRETNPAAQGAMVRAAAMNLSWVRQNIHRLTRERRTNRDLAA